MSFTPKRYTSTDVGIAFAQLMEEVRKAGHPREDMWSLVMGSRTKGIYYSLYYNDGRVEHIQKAVIGHTAKEATRYLEAMRDAMCIIRVMRETKEERDGTSEGS